MNLLYNEFIKYCLVQNERDYTKSNDLDLLFEEFKKNKAIHFSGSNKCTLELSNLEDNESHVNVSSIVADFYSYPFLQDQWFLENIKLQPSKFAEMPRDIENYILRLQIKYYSELINPLFKEEMITTPSTTMSLLPSIPSKCPFSRIQIPSTIQNTPSFATESLSRAIHSKIDSVHIIRDTRMNVNEGKVVRIICPSAGSNYPLIDADYQIILNGLLKDFKMDLYFNINSNNLIILFPETKICANNVSAFVSDCRFSSEILVELCKVRKTFTSSDILFLFPSKVFVINPIDLDRFINLIVYMNIFGVPFGLKEIKMLPVYFYKHLEPSFIEPYSDVLSVDFIKENPDLFQ